MRKYLCLFFALALSGCGGSGGSDAPSTPPSIEGHWVGSVFIDPKQECLGPDTIDLSGKPFALDIDPAAGNGAPLVLDQDGAFFLGDPIDPDGSFVASALNQPSGNPSGATGMSFAPTDRNTANVSLYVFYSRFCSSRFNGTFTRAGGAAEPRFSDIKGTWTGSLPPIVDDCKIGAALNETHQVAYNGINVSLVSTDGRLLTGKWMTTSSFSVESSDGYVTDTVTYEIVGEHNAVATITHYDGNAVCSTIWQGDMVR